MKRHWKRFISLASTVLLCGSAAAVEPGEKAPDFTLPSMHGESVTLSDHEGKIVVLEWINHECPFVNKHYGSGNLPGLQEKYRDKGVVWLVINSSAPGKQGHLDAEGMIERSKKEGSNATHVLLDPEGKVGKAYGAKVTPHMFVINPEGEVAYNGAIDSKPTTKVEDIETATDYVSEAIDAVMAGDEVPTKTSKPYGCGVKY